MPDSPDKRKKKKKPAAGTPSSNSSPDLSPKLRVRSAPIDFGEPKAAFTSTAVESRTPSVQPPTQSFDVTLRAERAEAAAVELRAQLQSRTVEAHTSLIDIRHADDLTAACEASLKWQLRQVANYMAELSHERAVGGEQREALTHAAQQIEELQAVVAHLEKQLEAERTSAAAAKAKYHEQGDVWRTGAERIRDERAADAVRKVERYRVWEHTIAKWLEDGRNKKLDPVLHGENLGIYERLAAMITDEILILERQQQAWDETLSAQKQAEVDALEAQAHADLRLESRPADTTSSQQGLRHTRSGPASRQLADARGALDALNKTRTALEKKTEQAPPYAPCTHAAPPPYDCSSATAASSLPSLSLSMTRPHPPAHRPPCRPLPFFGVVAGAARFLRGRGRRAADAQQGARAPAGAEKAVHTCSRRAPHPPVGGPQGSAPSHGS